MKKLFSLLFVMAMFVFFSPFANAQTSCTVSANVVTTLSVSETANVDFGQILSTTTGDVVLDPTGASNSNVGASAAAGEFTVSGGNSASVTITYDNSVTLSSGANTMDVTPSCSGYTTATQGSSTTFSSGATKSLSSSGAYYIWVGGTISALTSQAQGSYSGTFNVTVAYN